MVSQYFQTFVLSSRTSRISTSLIQPLQRTKVTTHTALTHDQHTESTKSRTSKPTCKTEEKEDQKSDGKSPNLKDKKKTKRKEEEKRYKKQISDQIITICIKLYKHIQGSAPHHTAQDVYEIHPKYHPHIEFNVQPSQCTHNAISEQKQYWRYPKEWELSPKEEV